MKSTIKRSVPNMLPAWRKTFMVVYHSKTGVTDSNLARDMNVYPRVLMLSCPAKSCNALITVLESNQIRND